jgi:EAL domain-containing protein (putative c-di-GMP-specific phosphodiesterase class I)
MSTQEFVTMIEAVGLSRELDLAVLQRAAATMIQSHLSIAVNVSGMSLAEPSFTRQLLLEAAGVPAGRLLIELTETAEIDDLSAVAAQLDCIRAAGIAVCLDDFGAGSASFRYLRDLPVDFVKIDGAYVRAAGRSEQGRSFIRAMQDLANSAGAKTIAEMIETEAEAALMLELGVAYGQGFLFGVPAPIPPTSVIAQPSARATTTAEVFRPPRWKY